jgi:hypothetical protein
VSLPSSDSNPIHVSNIITEALTDQPPSGTPTSTTTSLSALSTTAIKDGHRGALPPHGRGHHSNPSTNSLEAERADRISRLAGLSSVSRPNNNNSNNNHNNPQSGSAQTTPTSSGFLPQHGGGNYNNPALQNQYLTPAYFDAQGQPVAATKMSTVGTASASATTAQDRMDEEMGNAEDATDIGDDATDLQSMDTFEEGSASASGYRDMDHMDEDRSVGGFEDRMSDDGSASLVGFGEGAGSTVSGPIYHRRPIPGGLGSSSAGAMDRHIFGLDRRDSGLSTGTGDGGVAGSGRRETVVGRPQQQGQLGVVGGADTPVSPGAEREHRAALQIDGVAVAEPDAGGEVGGGDDRWVDTSARGPVPVTSAIRETQQPGSHQQQASAQYPGSTSREAAERIVRERLGEEKGGATAMMESPKGEGLGRFYFEEKK